MAQNLSGPSPESPAEWWQEWEKNGNRMAQSDPYYCQGIPSPIGPISLNELNGHLTSCLQDILSIKTSSPSTSGFFAWGLAYVDPGSRFWCHVTQSHDQFFSPVQVWWNFIRWLHCHPSFFSSLLQVTACCKRLSHIMPPSTSTYGHRKRSNARSAPYPQDRRAPLPREFQSRWTTEEEGFSMRCHPFLNFFSRLELFTKGGETMTFFYNTTERSQSLFGILSE